MVSIKYTDNKGKKLGGESYIKESKEDYEKIKDIITNINNSVKMIIPFLINGELDNLNSLSNINKYIFLVEIFKHNFIDSNNFIEKHQKIISESKEKIDNCKEEFLKKYKEMEDENLLNFLNSMDVLPYPMDRLKELLEEK